MTESVEVLSHLANEEKPPLGRGRLEGIRRGFRGASDEKMSELKGQLGEMSTAFQGRGDLTNWPTDALNEIDGCFLECFMTNGQVSPWAFVPGNEKYLIKFVEYCDKVDRVLVKFTGEVPVYAREWFAFYSIWEVHGYAFPMPLGTSSVISAMAGILGCMEDGVVEVSRFIDLLCVWCYGYATLCLCRGCTTRACAAQCLCRGCTTRACAEKTHRRGCTTRACAARTHCRGCTTRACAAKTHCRGCTTRASAAMYISDTFPSYPRIISV
jgi:hypothetical protein